MPSPGRSSSRRRLAAAGAAVATAAAVALSSTAAAHADSITFTRGGNVWVADADGSGQTQLTTDGGYASTSQADDGTIVAQRGRQIARITRSGTVTLLDSVTTRMPNAPVGGPWDPEISPDGTKLAYWVGASSAYLDPSSGINFVSVGAFTIWANATDGTITGMTSFHETPSWVGDSSGALLWDPTAVISPQAVFATPGQNHKDIRRWFWDALSNPNHVPGDGHQVGAGEIARAGNRVVAVRSAGSVGATQLHAAGNGIAVFDVANGYDSPPVMRDCTITGQGATEVDNPQLSPDGNTVIWEEASGIWAADIGAGGCGTPRQLIAGGYRPDWGIAARGSGRPAGGGGAGAGAGADANARIPRRARAASLRRGLKVVVSCPSACDARIVVRDRRARVGVARVEVAAGQHRAVRVRLSRGARVRLGHAGHRRLTVTVAAGATRLVGTVAVHR